WRARRGAHSTRSPRSAPARAATVPFRAAAAPGPSPFIPGTGAGRRHGSPRAGRAPGTASSSPDLPSPFNVSTPASPRCPRRTGFGACGHGVSPPRPLSNAKLDENDSYPTKGAPMAADGKRATEPEQVTRLIAERLNAGDVDGIAELYEED